MTNLFWRGAPLGGADLSDRAARSAAHFTATRAIPNAAWGALLQPRIETTTVVAALLSRPAAAQELSRRGPLKMAAALCVFGTTCSVSANPETHPVARLAEGSGTFALRPAFKPA